MTKALISGYYGFKNFGDETILSILVEHLKALNVDITVLSGDVEYTKQEYEVSSINRFDIKSIISNVKTSDILISGGGSLLQDVTSLKSLVYYLFIISLGVLYNKKVIIFAQGIGPINNLFARILTKFVLKKCTYVSVRDVSSQKLLEKWNIESDLLCDPVYSLDISNKQRNNSIGVQLRDFPTMNIYLLQKLALLINAKFSNYKIKLFSLQRAQDFDLCIRFRDILKSINPHIDIEIVSENIIDRISELDYLFGMRFHALLVALKAGVKSCAINYDIKVEKLANDAQIPIISMDAHENIEEIFQKLQELDSEKLKESANSKQFDWSKIDQVISFS